MRRPVVATATLLSMLALAGCSSPPTDDPRPSATATAEATRAAVVDGTERILVIGDSITLGTNACGAEGSCESESWATGDDPVVDSLRDRVRAQNRGAEVEALARSGARMGSAAAALEPIVATEPDLAIVLLGANDACARTLADMTAVDDYAAALRAVLDALAASPGSPAILVMSVPDLESVWEELSREPSALSAWSANPACQSLFADAHSEMADADAGRAEVTARVDAYNAAIAEQCGAVAGCSTDAGLLNTHRFTTDEISTVDYFHPSIAGQATISAIVWDALVAMPANGG